jgi:hypothetical protein
VDWEHCLHEGLGLPRGVEAVEMVVLHGFSLLLLSEQRQEEEEGGGGVVCDFAGGEIDGRGL